MKSDFSILPQMKAGLARAANFILPPRSVLTGDLKIDLDNESELWSFLQFLDEPCCQTCGFPFDYDLGEGVDCARCMGRKPAYDHARAAFRYDDASRKMILDFKHGGKTQGVDMFVRQLRRAGRHVLGGADWLVPVPLHPSRLRKRRFNQSALLARRLAQSSGGAAFNADLLMRVKKTATQGGKSYVGRKRNVSGAFAVRLGKGDDIKGRNIVLIDDVFTTGATLESCARTLRKAGAAKVDAITLARVVKPAQMPT